MPNYGLVINSRFRPFSYQEMLAPVQQSTEAHQALENAYEEVNTNASIWEGLANKESDPITYQRYKNFADALKTQADELAANGLNPTSRQAVSDLRARYASDIIPIKNAYEKRQADIKAQQEILLKDPTHFFNRKANETSLDEYLTNDKLDVLSDQYSGALLTQQVGQAAQTLKNTLTNKGALSKLGLPYQYERMLQYGASADDVLKAMSRDPQAAPILTKLVDDVMAASGIRNWSSMNGDWANSEMYRRAEAYAMQGLYNAIGTSKIDNFTDSYSQSIALQENKARLDKEAAQSKEKDDEKLNTLPTLAPLRSTRELSKANKNIEKYREYFKKDSEGNYTLTRKGYEAMYWDGGSDFYTGEVKGPSLTPFGKFMKELSGNKDILKVNKNGHVIGLNIHPGTLFANYEKNNQADAYDTYRSTEGVIHIDSGQRDDITSAFFEDAGTGKKGAKVLQAVDFNGKNGWENIELYKVADLSEAGYQVTSLRPSVYGMTAYLQAKGKEPIRVLVPEGVNIANIEASKYNMNEATKFNQMAQSEYLPAADENNNIIYDENGNVVYTNVPMTNVARIYLTNQARLALSGVGSNTGSLVRPSKSEITKY